MLAVVGMALSAVAIHAMLMRWSPPARGSKRGCVRGVALRLAGPCGCNTRCAGIPLSSQTILGGNSCQATLRTDPPPTQRRPSERVRRTRPAFPGRSRPWEPDHPGAAGIAEDVGVVGAELGSKGDRLGVRQQRLAVASRLVRRGEIYPANCSCTARRNCSGAAIL